MIFFTDAEDDKSSLCLFVKHLVNLYLFDLKDVLFLIYATKVLYHRVFPLNAWLCGEVAATLFYKNPARVRLLHGKAEIFRRRNKIS